MATRIALITPPLDSSGGIGRLMSYVLASMPRTEAEIYVLDPRGHSQRPIWSVFSLARAWVTLVALGVARRVDVAHINMSSHGSSVRKPIMLWTCRMLRIPVILHLHASEYPAFFSTLPPLAKRFLRRTFAAADVVLVLGSQYREYVCNDLAVPARKVRVLLNGSPGPDSAPVRAPRSGSEPLKILFLGRLGERKGVPELLAALADHRFDAVQWLATLAGDGDVAHYRAQARALGLGERVRFPGWVSTPDANRLLLESDVLVLPSRAEGLPMSVIEAFAYGVPVVSTAVGAIGDIVEHGFNGLLVPAGDSAPLADALLTLLADDSLRRRLACNARRTWENELDIASYARKLTSYWQTTSTATVRRFANA